MNPIIASARSFIGTRFHHQGRLKKTGNHRGGIDCLGLLVGVARECNLRSKTGELLADVDEFNYPHYPDTIRLREMLERHLISLPIEGEGRGGGDLGSSQTAPHLTSPLKGGGIREADIVLFEIDGRAQHMGIISTSDTCHPTPDTLTLIHAYAPARAVVEHALDDYWREKMVALYRVTSSY